MEPRIEPRIEQGRSLLRSNAALSPVADCSRPRSFRNIGNRILALAARHAPGRLVHGVRERQQQRFRDNGCPGSASPNMPARAASWTWAVTDWHPQNDASRDPVVARRRLTIKESLDEFADIALRLPQRQSRGFSCLVLELEPRHQLHGSASHGDASDLADMSRTDQRIRQGEAGMVGEVLNFGLELEAHALT